MAVKVGVVGSLVGGRFYVKDIQGNVKELRVGDEIYDKDTIFGDAFNSDSAKVEVFLENNDIVVFSDGQKQLIDPSLIQSAMGREELYFTIEDIEPKLDEHNAMADVESDLRAKEWEGDQDDVLEEDTTEGEEEVEDTEGSAGQFDLRDGEIVDIESDLRKKPFPRSHFFLEADGNKHLMDHYNKELGQRAPDPFSSNKPFDPFIPGKPPVNPYKPEEDTNKPTRPESDGPSKEPEPEIPTTPPTTPPTPPTPPANLSIDDITVYEQDGMVYFTVSIDRAMSGDIIFSYKTSDIGAISGEDYMATSGTATIPSGQTKDSYTYKR